MGEVPLYRISTNTPVSQGAVLLQVVQAPPGTPLSPMQSNSVRVGDLVPAPFRLRHSEQGYLAHKKQRPPRTLQ